MGGCCARLNDALCPRTGYKSIGGGRDGGYERRGYSTRGATANGGGRGAGSTVPSRVQANSIPRSISARNGGRDSPNSDAMGFKRAQQELQSKYDLSEVIGVGSTSTVHRCIERATGKEFACKVIDKRMIEMKFRGLLDQFQIEIGVLKTLNHPNIIHLEDVFETENKIYMIMELMKGGELFDYVVEKGTLSEEEASDLVRRLASAIAYMHSMEIIHRDLKPENLLLTHRGPDAEVKIIDFGLSKILSGSMAKSFLGTRGYLAPEMLQRQTYSKTIDVWALGVIVFVLLCGCLPFDDDSSKMSSESVQQKFQLRFPSWASNLSSGAKDLLIHLLDINPRTRYTAEQALSHAWVNGNVKANNYLQSPKGIRDIMERSNSRGNLAGSAGAVRPAVPPAMPVPKYPAPNYGAVAPVPIGAGTGTGGGPASSASRLQPPPQQAVYPTSSSTSTGAYNHQQQASSSYRSNPPPILLQGPPAPSPPLQGTAPQQQQVPGGGAGGCYVRGYGGGMDGADNGGPHDGASFSPYSAPSARRPLAQAPAGGAPQRKYSR